MTEGTATGMLWWVAEAALEMRIKAGRIHSHVAAELSMDQSAISRFEKHESQPRNIDRTINGYARDLDIDPRQIWARALEMWIEAESPSPEHASRAVKAARDASPGQTRSRQQSGEKRPAKGKPREDD